MQIGLYYNKGTNCAVRTYDFKFEFQYMCNWFTAEISRARWNLHIEDRSQSLERMSSFQPALQPTQRGLSYPKTVLSTIPCTAVEHIMDCWCCLDLINVFYLRTVVYPIACNLTQFQNKLSDSFYWFAFVCSMLKRLKTNVVQYI